MEDIPPEREAVEEEKEYDKSKDSAALDNKPSPANKRAINEFCDEYKNIITLILPNF